MKTYVLIIAKNFLKKHPRAGQPTEFYQKIMNQEKIHTIRLNYELWEKRIDEVNAGKARISVREWTGEPYNSPQKELFELHKNEVGIQKIEEKDFYYVIDGIIRTDIAEYDLSKNDGLELVDFVCWFSNKINEPMAIIHFTERRY